MEDKDQTKRCSKCGLFKSLDEFHNSKSFKDGKTYICKDCSKKKRRRNYLLNRETELKKHRLYAADHKLEIEEFGINYRIEHREELLAKGAVYRSGRKEIISSASKKQRRTSPEIHMFRGAKKRAKQLGIPFLIDQSDIIVPCACPILGIPLKVGDGVLYDGSPTLDRLVPELGYIPENISVISNRANRMKDNGTAEEHRLLADWIEGKQRIAFETKPAERKHAGTLITCAKGRALREKVPFAIQKEDMLIPDICPAIGIPIIRGKGKMHGSSPTLDKIIPELGYVLGNIAIISLKANRMKSNGTATEHRLISDWMDAQFTLPTNPVREDFAEETGCTST